ncbi:HEAT repeat domain-containing protein [Chloroflexota bacterium]
MSEVQLAITLIMWRSTDTYVRLLGCVGLGAFGDPEAVRDLRPMLEDEDLDVQLAAGLALGAIPSENALKVMVQGLLTGEENLRQAVAEAMAAIPGEGHQILHEAATMEDMMVRRASVFGLARIGTPWALTDLYRRLLEDDQWYVRSAAEQAFADAQSGTQETIQAHPPLETLEWLVEQVVLPEESSLEAGEGEEGEAESLITEELLYSTLLQLLGRGEEAYRIASARTLGYLGYAPALKPLYQVLGDQNQEVRAASFAALSDVQVKIGQGLPGVQ